jgi:hypothetical protein
VASQKVTHASDGAPAAKAVIFGTRFYSLICVAIRLLRFAAGVAPVSLWSGIVSGETRWVQEVRPAVWALTGDDLCQQLADARRVLETVTAVPAGHDDTRLGVQPADEELPIG